MPTSLKDDWYDGVIPDNVLIADGAHIETSYSFTKFLSQQTVGLSLGISSSVYLSTMFDIGPRGQVTVGDFAMLNGVEIICDSQVDIADHVLLSWGVVILDSYRVPTNAAARRLAMKQAAASEPRRLCGPSETSPVRIGSNAWIGFGSCVLPGVTIGEGAVVGARSVVTEDVASYSIIAGNPARPIRQLEHPQHD